MNRSLHHLIKISTVVIVGVCLAVLAWLGTISICSRTSKIEVAKDALPIANTVQIQTTVPQLLPSGGFIHCMPAVRIDPRRRQIAECPIRQVNTRDSGDGPILGEPAQSKKAPTAYIPSIGIVSEDNFDKSSGNSSPPVWMPKEMPKAGTAYHTLPEPKIIENPTALNPPAEPAVVPQESELAEQSDAIPADQEYIYPSTEPLYAQSEVVSKLPIRTEQLESIAQQADRITQHGFELAGRGAYFAARSEFIASLRLVSQGLDTQESTNIHGKALAAGLMALKEADDFIPSGSKLEADLDLPCIIANHTTPVLKNADKNSITTLTAMKSYMTFAQMQLAQAVGNETAGSMALHALGKLHDESAKSKGLGVKASGPKSIAFYQASLIVGPNNSMAANDLGVMLAKNGNLEDARKMLEHSCSISGQSEAWHNLAVVNQRLGNAQNAAYAQQQASLAQQNEQIGRRRYQLAGTGNQVRWVNENAFAQNSDSSGMAQNTPVQVNRAMQPAGTNYVQTPQQVYAQPQINRQPQFSNPNQSQQAANDRMPSMKPATTGRLPMTSYDARR